VKAPSLDVQWYLKNNPDVAAAGVDPLQHYLTFGKNEGRWPCALPALELDQELWQAAEPEPFLVQLQQLFEQQQSLHSALAAWVLARWYGSLGQWQQGQPLLPTLLNDDVALSILVHQGPFLLAFATYFNCQHLEHAQAVLAHPLWSETHDKQLQRSMLLSGGEKLRLLNQIFAKYNLVPLRLDTATELEQLQAEQVKPAWYKLMLPVALQPKVSVIVPCFNAEKTLATALKSLLAQSHRNLEILVADDCSTDHSAAIVQQIAARDRRVKLVQLAQNSGAYVARNTALLQASGEFITTHDSDDWSHPQKIALQVAAFKGQTAVMATASHWVRCSPDLQFQRWRMEDVLIFRNISSLMFRRSVVQELGFWDRVSVNADTEFYYRIIKRFGPGSIVEVLPGVPLSFGRADELSLSRTKATHLRTQFRGLRKDHIEAAFAWHEHAPSLYLAAEPKCRPFAVPPLMCRGTSAQREHNFCLLLEQKQLFDAAWYLRHYPDVAASGSDPLQHFVKHGAAEGRDPLPCFSFSGYAFAKGLEMPATLASWLTEAVPPAAPVAVKGELTLVENLPVVMVVGHSVSAGLFGAERSLLDNVQALAASQKVNLIVVLPGATDKHYVAQMRSFCCNLIFVPFSWWQRGRAAEQAWVEAFVRLIDNHSVSIVYVNTLVLLEPLLAAKQAAIKSVVHVHELPAHDPALCQLLNADAEAVRQHVLAHSDYLIANSETVARWLACPENISVVPNILNIADWPFVPLPSKAVLQVVMLSSNLPKKGIADVVEVARYCWGKNVAVTFRLYGPENEFTNSLRREGLPDNLRFCGYTAAPQQVIADADVVLNLSHFQESFGRTVQEAMAAGRVVVAYDWGALAELIKPNCGILISFKDTREVAEALAKLVNEPTLREELGRNARAFVSERFSAPLIGQQLLAALFH